MTKPRAQKTKWNFHEKRDGDTIIVADAKARAYALSAFVNWMRSRNGTLKASSTKVDGGYRITFTGISPTEANRAHLDAGRQGEI